MFLNFIVSAYNESCLNMQHDKFSDAFAPDGSAMRILYENPVLTDDYIQLPQIIEIDDEILFPFMTTGLNSDCFLFYSLVMKKFYILSDQEMIDYSSGRASTRPVGVNQSNRPSWNDMLDWDDDIDENSRFCIEVDNIFHDELLEIVEKYIIHLGKNLVRTFYTSCYFSDWWDDDEYEPSPNASHRDLYWYFNIAYEDYNTLVYILHNNEYKKEIQRVLPKQIKKINTFFGTVVDFSRCNCDGFSYKKKKK